MCVHTFESYSCHALAGHCLSAVIKCVDSLVMHSVHAASPLRHPMFAVLQATGGMADYIMNNPQYSVVFSCNL